MVCGQRKSHHTRTKQWNLSVMVSSITYNCIPAIVCSQHTWLVNRNHPRCYWYSHTFPITHLFIAYHTELVKLNHICSLGSTQTVHPSEPHAVYHTHLDLTEPFLLRCLIENNSSKWIVCRISHTPSSSWPLLLCCLITNSSSEWIVCRISHTPSSRYPFMLFRLITNS